MSNTNIDKLYDYTLQQMAAESYFEGIEPSDIIGIRQRLRLGTNRDGYKTDNPDLNEGYPGYTRMTTAQADEFLSKFTIAHQWSDNPTPTGSRPVQAGDVGYLELDGVQILANTGLSATLIQNKETGEYTLAIRSTEFRNWADGGDGERDKYGADIKSIAFTGFALAQQEALERYYTWLKQNGHLPAGAKLNVTGYSLGGNLATVFTEIHQNNPDIQFGETVTFNGAGRGQWEFSQGSLSDMLSYYHQVLNNPNTPPPRPLNSQEQLIRDNAVLRAGQSYDHQNIYSDQRYLWAVTATAAKFNLGFQALSDENRTGTLADTRITQLFGYETIDNTNFTANSGIHGPALRVGIESQPGLEGLAGGFIGSGDFGNGHSITLIADSLAIQRAIHKLDSAATLGRFIALLPSASNHKPTNGIGANYETDALENILDGLRHTLQGKDITETEFKDGASGFGDITKREGFYANLQALTDSDAFKSLIGKIKIVAAPRNGLDAKTDFSALLSLHYLTPFALKPVDSAAETALKGVHATLAAQWEADQALTTLERAQGKAHFSDQYLKDRAAMLSWVIERNQRNIADNEYIPTPVTTDKWEFQDLASQTSITIIPPAGTMAFPHYVRFGADEADPLDGGNLTDYLYGGGGNDTLNGKKGNDYLEGNAGNDTLDGGQGSDTLVGGADIDNYLIGDDGGQDVILDGDGKGKITLAGIELTGGKRVIGPGKTWQSDDRKITYSKIVKTDGQVDLLVSVANSDASVRIENYKANNLGIVLEGERSQTFTLANLESHAGGVHDRVAGSNISDKISTGRKADLVYGFNGDDILDVGDKSGIPGNGVAAQADSDFVDGGNGNDYIDGGVDNDYLLGGRLSTGTTEQAASENDTLIGGDGVDLIDGGIGNDVIIGGRKDEILFGEDSPTKQGDWLLGGDGDDIMSGSIDRDMLNGGADDDTIDGGASDDVILGDANYRFATLFNPAVTNGWPELGIAASVYVAAEHKLSDDGTDTVQAAPGIVIFDIDTGDNAANDWAWKKTAG